jgi:hypothetical protein
MPHRLDHLINQLFKEEADRAIVRAWATKLDRDGLGDRGAALERSIAAPPVAPTEQDGQGAPAAQSGAESAAAPATPAALTPASSVIPLAVTSALGQLRRSTKRAACPHFL